MKAVFVYTPIVSDVDQWTVGEQNGNSERPKFMTSQHAAFCYSALGYDMLSHLDGGKLWEVKAMCVVNYEALILRNWHEKGIQSLRWAW
jgi:hypothetical protein